MLDPQSHHNSLTQKVFFQWHTQYDPTWSINQNSEFFKFSQLTNKLVSLKNDNDVHKKLNWSGFEIKNWIEDQFQSNPKLVGIWTVLRCVFVPNLEIVTSISGELWHGQAQNGVKFDFWVQFDLEGHDQSSHKTIGILTKVFNISGPNLAILA